PVERVVAPGEVELRPELRIEPLAELERGARVGVALRRHELAALVERVFGGLGGRRRLRAALAAEHQQDRGRDHDPHLCRAYATPPSLSPIVIPSGRCAAPCSRCSDASRGATRSSGSTILLPTPIRASPPARAASTTTAPATRSATIRRPRAR